MIDKYNTCHRNNLQPFRASSSLSSYTQLIVYNLTAHMRALDCTSHCKNPSNKVLKLIYLKRNWKNTYYITSMV